MKKLAMFVVALVMVAVFVCPVVNAGYNIYRPGNIGKQHDDSGLLGHVAGNGISWDYALVFKLKKNDPYAALADIESSVSGDDTLVAVGYYGKFIIMTIESDDRGSKIESRYARASRLTRLIRVNDRNWINSNQYDAIVFNDLTFGQLYRDK